MVEIFPLKFFLFPQMLSKFALSGKYYLRFFLDELEKINDFFVKNLKNLKNIHVQ